MKANELMIGDWVQFSNGNKIKSRINCISPYQKYVGHTDNATWLDSFDDIEPIPLTEEILKMNGFELSADEDMWYVDDFYLTAGFTQLIGGSRWITYNFVHELQHALRLCGLNDLADNFKVTIN